MIRLHFYQSLKVKSSFVNLIDDAPLSRIVQKSHKIQETKRAVIHSPTNLREYIFTSKETFHIHEF